MPDTVTQGSLTCPKCGGAMRSYERSGITVDRCTECRGVFLDRGELERLIDAEAASYEGRETAPGARGDESRGSSGHGKQGRGRKSSGFLGSIFEGFGGE